MGMPGTKVTKKRDKKNGSTEDNNNWGATRIGAAIAENYREQIKKY